MSSGNIFMLFAPAFNAFGCDVARQLLHRRGGGKVYGLCTGGGTTLEEVAASLGDLAGALYRLETEEEKWLSTPVSTSDLERLENELGPGAFGRIVVSDRRVGRGFVRSGLVRPDRIGQRTVANPGSLPQRYVAGLCRYLDNLLQEAEPDIAFCYAVAAAPAVALAEVCRARGIAFARLSVTRFGGRFLVDDAPAGLQAPVARRFKQALAGKATIPPGTLKEAQCLLEEFRQKPKAPEYSRRNTALLRSQSPLKVTARASLGALKDLARLATRGNGSLLSVERRFFDTANVWRRTLHSGRYFTSPSALDRPFIYYPLHVDPEASTMVLAPWHTDQLSIIEALAKSAPAHMQVVVKEHTPMLGRRPRGFYGQIARMPRVALLHPDNSSLELVQRAALTAVITGTAAWEALCFGQPALVIGDAPYLALGAGLVHETNASRFPQAIARALKTPPAPAELLELYIAASLAESFEMPSSLLWGRYLDHPQELRQACASRIADGIVRFIGERAALEPTA